MNTPIGPQKNFIIKCIKCCFTKLSTGLADDLKDLKELSTCANCGGRKFKCPKCGNIMKMKRVKYNR